MAWEIFKHCFHFFIYLQHVFSSTMDQFKTTFIPEQEQEMVGFQQTMESRLFGLTKKGLRKLTYQLADNKLRHGFNREDKLVDLDLLKGSLNLHPESSLSKPLTHVSWSGSGF
jgi:hypothetical protein